MAGVSFQKMEQAGLGAVFTKALEAKTKLNLSKEEAEWYFGCDFSGSMELASFKQHFYSRGNVQDAAEWLLAGACTFDRDGKIDSSFFSNGLHTHPQLRSKTMTITIENYRGYINQMFHDLGGLDAMGGTDYSAPLEHFENLHFSKYPNNNVPAVFVILTDGNTGNAGHVRNVHLRLAGRPVHVIYLAIGRDKKQFLDQMDNNLVEWGAPVDNVSVIRAHEIGKRTQYRELFKEYPSWLANVRKLGILVG
jgi:hypothetical protein